VRRSNEKTNRRRLRAWLLAIIVALPLLAALPAAACPVCYGEAEGEVVEGTQWSVAFLGGLVYLVMGGGVGMVVMQRRRVQNRADSRPDSNADLSSH
jgi:hypothetical protein